MSTPTAIELIDRIRHNPELLEDIRQLLNKEAGYTTQTVHTSHELSSQPHRPYPLGRPNANKERDKTIAQRVWAGEKRRDIAVEYQLSLPRINQILAEYPNPNPQPRVSANAERDRLILDAARKKVPRAEIARQHNLSVIRVNQIVGAAPKPTAPTFADKVADAMRKYDNFDDMTIQEECLVMVGKYEPIARRITQDLLDGMGLQQLEDKYPADITGDIPWTAEHYRQVASIMYNFETGAWRR